MAGTGGRDRTTQDRTAKRATSTISSTTIIGPFQHTPRNHCYSSGRFNMPKSSQCRGPFNFHLIGGYGYRMQGFFRHLIKEGRPEGLATSAA